MNLNSDTAKGRGIRTAIQALVGFVSGLLVVVWAVPGVQDAIWNYLTNNIPVLLLTVGVPAATTGIVSWIWNVIRKDVQN